MTARTTILMDPDLLERLGRYAHRERTTKTAIITAAVEAWLREHDRPADLAFIGIAESGHGRLSIDGRRIARREAGRPSERR
jgi:predicted transcriptional regulator